MFIYHIILEYNFPFDTEEFWTAPDLELREAQWMVRTFPFEEPEYLIQHPEEGPAPHILFVNLERDYYLLVSYEGESRYAFRFGKGKGEHRILGNLGIRELQEAVSIFWDSNVLFEDLWEKIKTVYQKYTFL
jgi:hypothetical protein